MFYIVVPNCILYIQEKIGIMKASGDSERPRQRSPDTTYVRGISFKVLCPYEDFQISQYHSTRVGDRPTSVGASSDSDRANTWQNTNVVEMIFRHCPIVYIPQPASRELPEFRVHVHR